jgi:hypothetical protein
MTEPLSMFDYCKQIFDLFNNRWPYPGSLADARDAYRQKKTVEKCVEEMKARASRKRK